MSSRFDELRIFSGNGNPALAHSICSHMSIPMGNITIWTFKNDNIFVRLSDRIMELLIMLDTCRRASAGRVTAVIPYFAYGRTDKKDQPRVPITARLLADLIQVAGAQQVITMDLHAGQIQGFFSIPVDELSAMSLLVKHFQERGWVDSIFRRRSPSRS
jgi:ribose-phosphate pyrophosphokinase